MILKITEPSGFETILPDILAEIERCLADDWSTDQLKNQSIRIAIDGNCGSGKTTLAGLIAERLDANLFHMDDFYISWKDKTPERLAEPGGNVDYERFYEEVLLLLISGKPFSYRKFNPIEQTLGVPESVLPKQFTIVEGAYSLHPKLKSGYDFKILLKITPDLQELRILKRNGEDGLNRFKTMWIPLENAYFEAYPLDTEVDLIIDVC